MNKNEKGQVLLIVVLVMVVVLTVGLSVASRSITNLRISTEEENSQRAFSAAEAGVEQALKSQTAISGGVFSNNATYDTSVVSLLGTEFLVNSGNPVVRGDGTDIWLVDHNSDGTPNYLSPWSGSLVVHWGSGGADCSNAALEIIVISGTQASPTSIRYALDPCSDRRTSNRFCPKADPSCPAFSNTPSTVAGKTFPYSTNITISSGMLVRVLPLYASTPVGVVGGVALPKQGSQIESTGKSGGTVRKINVFQGFSQLPSEFFPYILFSTN